MSIKEKSSLPVVGDTNPQVQSAVDVRHAERLQDLGKQVALALASSGEKLRDLCVYIHNNKSTLSKKLITRELVEKLGFKKAYVSQICRISFSPDKVFKPYEAARIGFHQAIDFARMDDKSKLIKITPAARLLTNSGALPPKDTDEIAVKESTPGSADGSGKGTKSISARLKSAAKFIATNATRNMTYTFSDARFKVTVEKLPKTQPSLGDS
jgi:hypothetical protein